MTVTFAFTVDGPALSQRTNRRSLRNWRQRIKDSEKSRWEKETPVVGDVMVTIAYFHDGSRFDIDNISNPLLDATSKLILVDDSQITDLLCRKRILKDGLEIQNLSTI
ncbi:MAG: RusA family crossover junction endodeoxyribonuclease [Caldilineaceae bacterium]|nr:RusA family crossover junction endodeoxyribonuclease [Caldilineaceae bacterium]